MRNSRVCQLLSVAALLCVIAGCQSASAINGAGYQIIPFTNAEAARLAANDPTAGPAIYSNNQQCRKDKACKK